MMTYLELADGKEILTAEVRGPATADDIGAIEALSLMLDAMPGSGDAEHDAYLNEQYNRDSLYLWVNPLVHQDRTEQLGGERAVNEIVDRLIRSEFTVAYREEDGEVKVVGGRVLNCARIVYRFDDRDVWWRFIVWDTADNFGVKARALSRAEVIASGKDDA